MSTSHLFEQGSMVQLVAKPAVIGVITGSTPIGDDVRYNVFHDGGVHHYFSSQIAAVELPRMTAVGEGRFRAGITSELLRDPAADYLRSLNAGRIDFEPYQYRPVLKIVQADRPRILVADDVGVGKTIEACLILKELQARGEADSVLVICPKPLVVDNKWRRELKRFDEDFIHIDSSTLRFCIEETYREGTWPDRYKKAILPYSLLNEQLLLGDDGVRPRRLGLQDLSPGPAFDLVIVDEAHHIRNTETWAYENVAHLTKAARAVVMLSATPVQTASTDLFTLVNLLRDDLVADVRDFSQMLEPNHHLFDAVEAARRAHTGWLEPARRALAAAGETSWGVEVLSADPRYRAVMDSLRTGATDNQTRVRIVRGLEDLNTLSDIVNRTRRRDIGEFTVRKPIARVVEFTPEQANVYEALMALAHRIATWQAPSMPVQFLLSMLQRQAASSITGLGPLVEDILTRRLSAAQAAETGDDAVELPDSVIDEFASAISDVAHVAARLGGLRDPKAEALRRILAEKQLDEKNKVLVFSSFRHTLRYLHENCIRWGPRVGVVHGEVPDDERRELRRRFRLQRADSDAIDVLLCSEVGTEGLDYQFCDTLVNYDLPWNPMRIEQRIGRIDRRGQKSEAVAIYNLLTEGTVEAEIYDRCLSRIGVFHRALGGSEEILGELTTEITRIADDLALSESERADRLRQLADNKIALIEEQERLEDQQADLFGLTGEFESRVESATSVWLDEAHIANLVLEYLDSVQPGRKVALRPGRVAVIRPSNEVADRLRADLRAAGLPNRRLERLLSRTAPLLRMTTSPDVAEEEGDDVELLGPTHPLVQVAARHAKLNGPTATSMRVTSDLVPPGTYEIAIHGWRRTARRDRLVLRHISENSRVEEHADALLASAVDAPDLAPAGGGSDLDERHHMLWSAERAKHADHVRTAIDRQIAALTARQARRVRALEARLGQVSDASIVTMTKRQVENEHADLAQQLEELQGARDTADVLARNIGTVTLEVVAP